MSKHIHEIEVDKFGDRTCKHCWLTESTIQAMGEEIAQVSQQKDAEWQDEFVSLFHPDSEYDGEVHTETDKLKAFISKVATQARQQAYNSGFCDGVKAQQDIIEKEIRANIEK